MTEPITTIELLDFLAKAHAVSSHHVTVKKVAYGDYEICVCCDWDVEGIYESYYTQTTFISDDGHSVWGGSLSCDFFVLDNMIDELVEREKKKEMKRQKREELLSRLTDEEKELLGVKS